MLDSNTTSNESINPGYKSAEKERINVQHNTFGDSILFPEEDYPKLHLYFERNLKFIKVGKQHGALYKTNDGLVTVTLYKSTSLIHVQGSAYSNWTKMFREQYTAIIEENNQGIDVSTIPKTVSDTSSEEPEANTNDTEGTSEGSRHEENDREIDTISTIPKTVSDTLPEESQTNAIDTEEASEGFSDESNVGLNTSIATFQLPMMSTPKFERYVPLSEFESLCEKCLYFQRK